MEACVKVFAFVCGIEWADWAIFDPLEERVGTKVKAPDFLYVVDHPSGLVVVDSGVSPDFAREFGEPAIILREDDSVVRKLESIGAKPSDVYCVIQTHLHYDHAGGLLSLPDARVLVQRRELEFARNTPSYQQGSYDPRCYSHEVHWEVIDGELDLFDDGLVRLIPTPGHTPGHQSVLVSLEEAPVLLAGDIHYSLEKMRERRLPAIVWSPDAMLESWELAERLEREAGARVLISHELGFETVLPLAPAQWL